GTTLRWDLESLWAGIIAGIAAAAARAGSIQSIGIDCWGVDYVLVDQAGTPLEAPYHHRDGRTAGIPEEVYRIIPEAELFARTGTAPLAFNTIFQLVAARKADPQLLARAHRLLTMPDYLHYRLCGRMANEWTNAGTTGLTVAGKPEWDAQLLARLGIPAQLLSPPVRPGTRLGAMTGALAARLGLSEPPMITVPACHDTASAVASLPARLPFAGLEDAARAFISSGTWSLMGTLVPAAITGEDSRLSRLSNEIAADGRIRLLKNIMGLWVVQECRRAFALAGRDHTYERLTALAVAAAPGTLALDVDDARFFPPGIPGDTMPDRVRAWFAERSAPIADDDGLIVRRVLEGLAAGYARSCAALERVTGTPLAAIQVLGGGCQNALLCQLTADACARPVAAGPVEAAVLGNLVVQARGMGWIADDRAASDVISRSIAVSTYLPRATARA
ncbi:MAG: rhamnulokinase, partial [Planctomycetes bacterium]|nr:rhamnulokinase [Planctomycetota bacterium]